MMVKCSADRRNMSGDEIEIIRLLRIYIAEWTHASQPPRLAPPGAPAALPAARAPLFRRVTREAAATGSEEGRA